MNLRIGSAVLLCATFFTGCRQQSAPPATAIVDKAAIEDKIHELDVAWVKASLAHDVDGWVSYYTEDAVVLPPNEKTLTGKASIRPEIAGLLGMKDVAVRWEPAKVVVADAGDLAYLYGTYTIRAKGSGAAAANDDGKIVEVWRRQGDGGWKCVLDGWSSDLPVKK